MSRPSSTAPLAGGRRVRARSRAATPAAPRAPPGSPRRPTRRARPPRRASRGSASSAMIEPPRRRRRGGRIGRIAARLQHEQAPSRDRACRYRDARARTARRAGAPACPCPDAAGPSIAMTKGEVVDSAGGGGRLGGTIVPLLFKAHWSASIATPIGCSASVGASPRRWPKARSSWRKDKDTACTFRSVNSTIGIRGNRRVPRHSRKPASTPASRGSPRATRVAANGRAKARFGIGRRCRRRGSRPGGSGSSSAMDLPPIWVPAVPTMTAQHEMGHTLRYFGVLK